MKPKYLSLLMLLFAFLSSADFVRACHGLPLVGISTSTSTGTHLIVTASSDPATCGCGPYILQVEIATTTTAFTGQAPAWNNASAWNVFPWYQDTLNVVGLDNCMLEAYMPVEIPYSSLACTGTTYYFRAREYVAGGGTPGPWSSVISFVTPGPPQPPSPFTASIISSPDTICGTNAMSTLSSIISGTCNFSGISYNWSPASSLSSSTGANVVATPTVTTTYTLTCTDASISYTTTATATIFVAPLPGVAVTASVPASCSASDGSITVGATGGNPPYTFSAISIPSNTVYQPPFTNLQSGTYDVIVTDAFGCMNNSTFILDDSCDYVWPGDANDDGMADNFDILTIGVANGTPGSLRPAASLVWVGQPSPAWVTSTPSGVNHKFVDCDGNAFIDLNDTAAVILNYGYVHNNRLSAPVYNLNVPDLRLEVTSDTLLPSSPGVLEVHLGSQAFPLNNLYGLAFTIHFNPQHIDENSLSMLLVNSLIGTSGIDMAGVKVIHSGYGRMDVAITRINQTMVNGYGLVCSFGFYTTSQPPSPTNTQLLTFSISGVRVIDNQESIINVNTLNDTFVLYDPTLSATDPVFSESSISIFPNPSNGIFTLNVSTNRTDNYYLTIYNAAGQLVWQEQLSAFNGSRRLNIDLSGYASGLYIVRLTGSDSEKQSRFIIH
jgi:hypothetical protein